MRTVFHMNSKVRLSKSNNARSWEQRITPYVPYILLCLFIILALVIFALACAVMGVSASSITGTEANMYDYGIEKIA